jgi:hypothetical protein
MATATAAATPAKPTRSPRQGRPDHHPESAALRGRAEQGEGRRWRGDRHHRRTTAASRSFQRFPVPTPLTFAISPYRASPAGALHVANCAHIKACSTPRA